jgi:hypothetical protein
MTLKAPALNTATSGIRFPTHELEGAQSNHSGGYRPLGPQLTHLAKALTRESLVMVEVWVPSYHA